jgi:AcrR family transcriptional regulator
MTMTMGDGEPGLRARKRAASTAAIQRAALELVLEHGYENVTVDMICEAGMISQRTFFNYFGSKEGVFLGGTPPQPTDEQIAAFVQAAGNDVVADLVRLIAAVVAGFEPDADLVRARRRVIQSTPELMNGQLARIGEIEDALTRIVLTRFAGRGRSVDATPDLEDEARMVVALAMSVLRYSMRKWFGGGGVGSREQMLHRSIDLIQRITGDRLPR